MSLFDDPKGWVRSQTENLRKDPRGWAQTQVERARELVDVAPFSDESLERELGSLRERLARLSALTPDEREKLHADLLSLHERLSPSGAAVSGAKLGLAASVLPLVGLVTGPLIGGAYGVYRSQRLSEARQEIDAMLRRFARG